MNKENDLLVDKDFIVKKFEGKGGWTFVEIAVPQKTQKSKFGWIQVSGTVDSFPLKRYKLMPMGKDRLFLPLKAELRKAINKKEGDKVRVYLYIDNSEIEIPIEITEVLSYEPKANSFFLTLSDSEKQLYISWVTSSKTEETKIKRMVSMVRNLEAEIKFTFRKNFA